MTSVVLYGTIGCHLCEQAQTLLEPVLAVLSARRVDPLVLHVTDIADDPVLMTRYGIRIPVLRVDPSEAELGWPFDQAEAYAFLLSALGSPNS